MKQPITPEEVERACRAVLVSCVEAVRYRGRDRNILRRLYDLGTYASCDAVPTELENRVSDHVQKVFPDLTTGWVKRVQEIFPDLTSKPVHWTFVCEDNSQAAVIACCYGPNPSTLAICEVAKASGEVTLILDDAKYRPQHADIFKSPKPTHR